MTDGAAASNVISATQEEILTPLKQKVIASENEIDLTKQIVIDPELKLVKCYLIRAGMKDKFVEFCEKGLPDQGAEGVCAWLRKRGVKRADFWICEPVEEQDNPTGDSEDEGPILWVAAVDKHGLKGPDWSYIDHIEDYLEAEYSFLAAKPVPELRMPLNQPGYLVRLLLSAWGQFHAFISSVARVF